MTETTQQNPERDLPEPRYKVLKQTVDTESVKQWLVETHFTHTVRVLGSVEDGKVKPPQYGETNHVLVTQRDEKLEIGGEIKTFRETSVYAADENGEFYNAAMYAAPGIQEIWAAMYAIGEI